MEPVHLINRREFIPIAPGDALHGEHGKKESRASSKQSEKKQKTERSLNLQWWHYAVGIPLAIPVVIYLIWPWVYRIYKAILEFL